MPEFKAEQPKRGPMPCSTHGYDTSCPGAYRCPGFLMPSPAEGKKEASDESVTKAVAELAGLSFESPAKRDAAVMERAKQLDALTAKKV